MKLIIFSSQKSARLNYVLKLIFQELLYVDYQLIVDKETFEQSTGFKLNYSCIDLISDIQIYPSTLLFEEKIKDIRPNFEEIKSLKVLYKNTNCPYGYDIFSAVFYLVSRYEEYQYLTYDQHGRYPSSNSILYKNNCLDEPIVNQWVLDLKDRIVKLNPELNFRPRSFEFLSTIDIDQAYQFKYKSYLRTLLGYFRDFSRWDKELLKTRWLVRNNKITDPFDSYCFQFNNHSAYKIQAIYFLQVGKMGRFDKNLTPTNPAFQNLIQQLCEQENTKLGLHPSYDSFYHFDKLKKEKEILENLIGSQIIKSRQHYLKFQLPKTYQNLIALGIKEEYTMGYSDQVGFRAGIAAPFFWFDLEKNEETKLRVFPFCSMDITPQHYYKMKPDEAILLNRKLLRKTKELGGFFSSLWHNESLGGENHWQEWEKVYVNLLKDATAKQ